VAESLGSGEKEREKREVREKFVIGIGKVPISCLYAVFSELQTYNLQDHITKKTNFYK